MAVWHMNNASFQSSVVLKNGGGADVRLASPSKYGTTGDFSRDGIRIYSFGMKRWAARPLER